MGHDWRLHSFTLSVERYTGFTVNISGNWAAFCGSHALKIDLPALPLLQLLLSSGGYYSEANLGLRKYYNELPGG